MFFTSCTKYHAGIMEALTVHGGVLMCYWEIVGQWTVFFAWQSGSKLRMIIDIRSHAFSL